MLRILLSTKQQQHQQQQIEYDVIHALCVYEMRMQVALYLSRYKCDGENCKRKRVKEWMKWEDIKIEPNRIHHVTCKNIHIISFLLTHRREWENSFGFSTILVPFSLGNFHIQWSCWMKIIFAGVKTISEMHQNGLEVKINCESWREIANLTQRALRQNDGACYFCKILISVHTHMGVLRRI